ncbi:TPM domain-containing protein [uncultured Litoreibacter sp.]|uniref:TPM domain-containing protein n=1 Tax=uncultured Litoreibacter sp. TaxID=1392394 RepID=UPI0026238A3B|nr:TPM domain-containing protein [uncultured Litoreibacter sp.]
MFRILIVLAVALLPALGHAQDKLPYPQHYTVLTNDFADILSPEAEAAINAELSAARARSGREMTVVTIRSREDYLPSADIVSFSKALFNGWGIGNSEKNDGLLLLVAIDDREIRIALGAGYPARQDGVAARIIQTQIVPAFREGRIADGILAGTRAALSQIRHPSDAEPTLSVVPTGAQDIQQRPVAKPEGVVQNVLAFMGDHPLGAAFLAALTALAGFFGGRYVQRYRPRKCPQCGNVMLRLGQAQEDQYLEHGQLVEERVKSKDYGVWFCTNDEHVTVIGYPVLFSKKAACPQCNYHTYETERFVKTPATTSSEGVAQLNHSCHNCHHKATETVSIPRVTESSNSRSSFSSGGSSSSSFGGGSSSGGGASGSW